MEPLNPQMMNPPAEKNICVFTAGPSMIQRKRKTNVCTLVARPRFNFINNSQITIYHLNQLNIEGHERSWKVKEGHGMSCKVFSYHQIDILSEKS